jgi:hypothetical protein
MLFVMISLSTPNRTIFAIYVATRFPPKLYAISTYNVDLTVSIYTILASKLEFVLAAVVAFADSF